MCGIIAVLRRPSSREIPELVEILGSLESVSNSLSLDDLNMLKKQIITAPTRRPPAGLTTAEIIFFTC